MENNENRLVGIEQLKSAIESVGKVRNSLLSAITKRICVLTDFGKEYIEFKVPVETNSTIGNVVTICAVDYGMSLVATTIGEQDVLVNDLLPIDSLLGIAERLLNREYFILTPSLTLDTDEKQGENKPVDKPEFKVGDWIVRGDTIAQILDIQKEYYVGLDINGKDFTLSKFLNDDKIHLWTIADAKDGDVLVDEDNNIGLYLEERESDNLIFMDDLYWYSCIYLGCDGHIYGFGIGGYHAHKNTKPATKEQRDLLFQQMEKAGYKWDLEKKELKSIESKFKVGDWV